MNVGQVVETPRPLGDGGAELPLWRLNLMRVGYAVMGVGLAVVRWPDVIAYDRSTPLYDGIVAVLLTAMSLLAFLGLRYPVRLLPILLFECLWKLIWLSVVALPAVVAGDVDEAMSDVIFSCAHRRPDLDASALTRRVRREAACWLHGDARCRGAAARSA